MNQTDQTVQNSVETFDKFKTCQGCPDRCISPNCHMTCPGYLKRQETAREINRERKKSEILLYSIIERERRNTYSTYRLPHYSRKR